MPAPNLTPTEIIQLRDAIEVALEPFNHAPYDSMTDFLALTAAKEVVVEELLKIGWEPPHPQDWASRLTLNVSETPEGGIVLEVTRR